MSPLVPMDRTEEHRARRYSLYPPLGAVVLVDATTERADTEIGWITAFVPFLMARHLRGLVHRAAR